MADKLREGSVLIMCNPLLDISVTADQSLLSKYNLQPNNAILAEEKHTPLYTEIVEYHKPDFIAGGSGQNTARIAQVILKRPNVVVYMGCVGRDRYSEILEAKARDAGVDVHYQYTDKLPTGTCAVLITENGKHRSLCANLAAANHFTIDHLNEPENISLIEQALYYYITGFFITVSIDSILEVAKISLKNKRTFMMNLSAPFICSLYKKQLFEALPYVDILFGNIEEATELAKSLGLDSSNHEKLSIQIADLPKYDNERKRVVVITQGQQPVILAKDGSTRLFETNILPPEKIVDTNGAGDAFVGGFISQLVLGKPYDICIKCGNWAASNVIQRSGCTIDLDVVFEA